MFKKMFGFDQPSVFNHNHFAQRAAKVNVFIKTRRIKRLRCNTVWEAADEAPPAA